MAYEQRHYQEHDESTSRSSDAWLSSLLAQPSDNSRAEIKNGLSSIRKMMEAQHRQSEELETPIMSSLTAMQSQMAQLVSALNTPSNVVPINRRQRLNADSLLADIEARQVEISGGQKKPTFAQRGPERRAETPVAAHSQSLMRQDLSALGHALADVVPQKTIDALRLELRHHQPQDLSSIHESLAMLASHIERLSQKPQPEIYNAVDNNALLDRKFEQLARSLRDSLQQQQPAAPSQDLERVFSILLQKIEATDRKIEQLAQRDTVKPAPLPEIRQPVLETPPYQPPAAPKAIDRLSERMKADPAPKPAPRATMRPVDTGNTAFDMPLEPGSGSPRNRVGLPQSLNLSSDIPMARISFETKDEAVTQNDATKSSSMQGLLAHKNKILIGLIMLLLAFGAVKAVDMVKPAPKKAATLQDMPIAPTRKIEVAKVPQVPVTQEAKLFAPPTIDPIITGSNAASPRVVPGVVVNNGWSPIVSPQEKNTLQSLADSGNPSAQFELANRMFDGKLLPKNEAAAIALYQKAVDQNFAPAQFRLGSLYEKGTGVVKNRDQASKLYLAAANLGHAKSMHNLAVLSADNSDGKSNLKIASEWFRKAAEHGVTDSQYNLAVLYARGLGVELSMTESYKWFALAALGGDADAGNKRDDLAKRLSPEVLSAVKIAVENFQPRKEPANATRVDLPAELSNNSQSSLLTRQISGKKI